MHEFTSTSILTKDNSDNVFTTIMQQGHLIPRSFNQIRHQIVPKPTASSIQPATNFKLPASNLLLKNVKNHKSNTFNHQQNYWMGIPLNNTGKKKKDFNWNN